MSEQRFWILDTSNESNRLDEVRDAAGFPIVAVVDEERGGVLAYTDAAAAEWLVETLNDYEPKGAEL